MHKGVYLAHINFDKEIEDLIVNHWPELRESLAFDKWIEYTGNPVACFGVVDHWTQLPLEALEHDERNLLVFLGRHAKEDQDERGGWRWHKWGPYLGVFQEQARANEYLYDTPDVIEVWSYRIVEISDTMDGAYEEGTENGE